MVGGGRMPVAYYLTAMLFILFDIEMVFLYPFAVSADALGLFGLVEIVLFVVTVGFAYVYVWRKGGLDWSVVTPIEETAGSVEPEPEPEHLEVVGAR